MPALSSKKRPASTQSGPASKKAKADSSKPATKKRSRPVTQTAVSPTELDSDGDEAVVVGDDEDMAWVDEEEVEETEEMAVDEAPLVAKDPNAARESHKAQRAVQDARRAAKPHSSLLADAKRLWSQAHRKDITPAERKVHITALMAVVKGHIVDIVFKHDASRIVQTLVKHGGQKERDIVAAELKGRYRELSQNKYSKFLVTKLIRLCPTHRPTILLEFSGHVLRLLLHRDASTVLADAFELHANAYERTLLLRDFYGKEVALFQGKNAAVEPADKDLARRGLEGVLDGADTERKKRIIQAVKEALLQIFNNPDKGAITHAITHRVFWEYLTAVNTLEDAAEREKGRREMFEVAQDVFAEMVHTKDGSRVVREFLAQGNAKDRKQILKTLKPHVARMCIDDEAQLVLFTALDVVDDTKLSIKTLVTDMIASASTLHSTPQGRRSLLYMLVPRSRRHFTPAVIASLASTDDARALTSKKDVAIRQNEIRVGASAGLIEWVAREGGEVCREPGGSLLVAEVMLFADGDKIQASHTLLQAIATPYPSPDAARPHGIDLPHTSRMYKTLLQGGHFDRTTNAVERPLESSWDSKAFAELFIKDVGPNVAFAMCVKGEMNGTFVVAELCAALAREGESEGREQVKKWFDDKAQKAVQDSDSKGKKVLMETIALL